ncbi:MAG: hypothetical protein RL660_1268 [Bacteroidota bacterium]
MTFGVHIKALLQLKITFHSLLLIALLLNSATGTAQAIRNYTTNANLWLMYSGEHGLSKKWGLHLEAQPRRAKLGLSTQQTLLRFGLNYYCNPSVFVTLGYAYVDTHPYGEFAVAAKFPEHRIYEQLQYKSAIGSTELIHRWRLEQRFLYNPTLQADSTWQASQTPTYYHRLRYMHRTNFPFLKKGRPTNYYAFASDEVFVNFGKNTKFNLLDQNRLMLGFGYKVSKAFKLEFAYLNHHLFKSDGIRVENNHTLLIALTSNANFYKARR